MQLMIKKAVIVSIFIALITLTFSQVSLVNATSSASKPTSPKPHPSPKPKPTSPKHGSSTVDTTFSGVSRFFKP